MQESDLEIDDMGPKPGYKQPGREGQKAVAFWLDEDVRAAFKIAATENGATMQEAFEQWVHGRAQAVARPARASSISSGGTGIRLGPSVQTSAASTVLPGNTSASSAR